MKSTSKQIHDARNLLYLMNLLAWPPIAEFQDLHSVDVEADQVDVEEDPPIGDEQTQ